MRCGDAEAFFFFLKKKVLHKISESRELVWGLHATRVDGNIIETVAFSNSMSWGSGEHEDTGVGL